MPDLLIRYSKLHGCHTAPFQTGEGAGVHGPTEVRRHGFHAFFFFLMLYISTPMLLSADNAITCNLRNSSPALFRNNQKILLLISF